jgi:PRC-barrel domain protein
MLLSDLLGLTVITTAGEELGQVHDVLLVQDGPLGARGQAGLRLHALAVGTRSFGTQLGYAQDIVKGPWLLRKLFARAPQLVPWNAIVSRDRDHIAVDASRIGAERPSDP